MEEDQLGEFFFNTKSPGSQAQADWVVLMIIGTPFVICSLVFSPECITIAACNMLRMACLIFWIEIAVFAGFSLLRLLSTFACENSIKFTIAMSILRIVIFFALIGAVIFMAIAYSTAKSKCKRLSILALVYLIIIGVLFLLLSILLVIWIIKICRKNQAPPQGVYAPVTEILN